MTTQAQIDANRLNAQKSTGPATPEGKARSAKNSLKHGLLSAKVVLEDEDAAQYKQLFKELMAELKPSGAIEKVLVKRIADQTWRLQRAVRIETSVVTAMTDNLRCNNGHSRSLQALSRSKRSSLQEAPDSAYDIFGLTVADDLAGDNRLLKLQRYEGRIERGLHRAIREFRLLRKQNKPNEPNSTTPQTHANHIPQEPYRPRVTADPLPNEPNMRKPTVCANPLFRNNNHPLDAPAGLPNESKRVRF